MLLSRVVIRGYRGLAEVDVPISERTTCVIGENNTGKSALVSALRLCLDVNLPSSYRSLLKDDIHSAVNQSQPFQVLIGVEFSDYKQADTEVAMLYGSTMGNGRARVFYRFRPKRAVREELASKARAENSLTLADYAWELGRGGDPARDLMDIEWNHDNDSFGATSLQLQDLQSYLVVDLQALRDVEADLQQVRRSPLARLIEASGIDEKEQQALIDAIRAANETIEKSPTIKGIATSVDTSLKGITGPAFAMDIDLGLAAPSFQAIVRSIEVILSDGSFAKFEPRRNGLGLNNILYIAILIEYFRKRAAGGKSAGELILIEEPEAHLHPQLQLTLLEALRALPFQTILTTHSTHVTSKAKLASFVTLTDTGTASASASTVTQNIALTPGDIADLERYLDATKSNLLFARKVLLVEGAAEAILLPPLVKSAMKLDLDREGISVVAIHGVHFGAFARLFNSTGLPKKCAIVADADLKPEDSEGDTEDAEDEAPKPDIAALEGPFVKAFLGDTTFEREITLPGNLTMLSKACKDIGAPIVSMKLEAAAKAALVDVKLQKSVLATAKRFGKARFAQSAAKYTAADNTLPKYIVDAIEWLRA